jgi:hypothetical protein
MLSRDFVELIHAVVDVLQVGIDIRPGLVGGTDGWPVVGRRSLQSPGQSVEKNDLEFWNNKKTKEFIEIKELKRTGMPLKASDEER